MRFVQLTPPGSACSISMGTGIGAGEPGTVKGLQLVVENADDAYEDLRSRGCEAGGVQEFPWGRFTGFEDPDGNTWAVQQIVPPGG
jgi:uncharacterized glyoxalase superfamily protein PhnB